MDRLCPTASAHVAAALSVRCSVTSIGSSFHLHAPGEVGVGEGERKGGVACHLMQHVATHDAWSRHPPRQLQQSPAARSPTKQARLLRGRAANHWDSRVLQLGGQLITCQHQDSDDPAGQTMSGRMGSLPVAPHLACCPCATTAEQSERADRSHHHKRSNDV